MKAIRIVMMGVALALSGCAGMQPVAEAEKTIESVVEVPSYTKDQIFNGSKVWIAENFRSAKSVIEYENKDEGTVIGHGSSAYPCAGVECLSTDAMKWNLLYTMRIDAKDGKFRVTFDNLRISKPASYNMYTGVTGASEDSAISQAAMPGIKTKLLTLVDSLKASLGKNQAKSNW